MAEASYHLHCQSPASEVTGRECMLHFSERRIVLIYHEACLVSASLGMRILAKFYI